MIYCVNMKQNLSQVSDYKAAISGAKSGVLRLWLYQLLLHCVLPHGDFLCGFKSKYIYFCFLGIRGHSSAGEVLPRVFLCETLLSVRGGILQGVFHLTFSVFAHKHGRKIAKSGEKSKLCGRDKDTTGLL